MINFQSINQSYNETVEEKAPVSSQTLSLPRGGVYNTFDHRFGGEPLIIDTTIPLSNRVTCNIEAGFHPGGSLGAKTREEQLKGFEDRFSLIHASDGSIVSLVIDGVGEMYTSQKDRTMYLIDSEERIVGDIPGYFLSKTFSEAAKDYPLRISTIERIKDVIAEANTRYNDFLNQNGLGHLSDGSKELIGGCTFALSVINHQGDVILVSAGDAIAVAKNSDDGILGTDNQLPDTNKAFEPTKLYLAEKFKEYGSNNPEKEMRVVFNQMFKGLQRNTFTNVDTATIDLQVVSDVLSGYLLKLNYLSDDQRKEIQQGVIENLPKSVKGYGFFDSNRKVVDNLQIAHIPREQSEGSTIVVCTDGAFESGSSEHHKVKQAILEKYGSKGILGLLEENQTEGRGPEATAIALRIF
jgi:hypothetical protein